MKEKILVISVISIFILIFIYASLPWVLMYISYQSTPDPPRPEITYGEFPFKLVYEIDGKEIVVEDTLICEFDGYGINEAVGKHRKWKEYLASNKKEDAVLITTDKNKKIYCSVGTGNYYMNDEKYPRQQPFTPRVYWVEGNRMGYYGDNEEDLLDMYNIKLISWEFSEPIVNSFK